MSSTRTARPETLAPARRLSDAEGRVAAERLAAIPGLLRGPHPILKSGPLQWGGPAGRLQVRLIQPGSTGPFPVVIFSHGNWSDFSRYDALLDHWASHGYLVVAPYHRDGGGMVRGIFNSLRYGSAGLIEHRVAELKWIIDELPRLDALLPGGGRRADPDRIAVAGHSFGAFTAQQLGGAIAVDETRGIHIAGRDKRVRAVMAISPPGPMFGMINDRSWREVDTPMLVTTGTSDVNARFWPDWRLHAMSFDTARPGANWLLVVEGADHYLGNLICRPERKAAPQADALGIVNAIAVTFLDAHLREERAARAYLQSGLLGRVTEGYATLTHR